MALGQSGGRRCNSSTPDQLEKIGIELFMTADAPARRTNDDGMKGFSDIEAFLGQVGRPLRRE